jgi:hypothetical protein
MKRGACFNAAWGGLAEIVSRTSEASGCSQRGAEAARLGVLGAAVLALVLAACGPRSQADRSSAEPATPTEEAGYLAPPALTGAERIDGRVRLLGSAQPDAEVRLASPDGALYTAAVSSDGRWNLTLPAATQPQMFAFSAALGDRTLRGEGAVVVTPAPGPPAMLLRAGFGAQSLGTGRDQPTILAVDYDASGGAAVAGLARPGAAVALSLDGARAGFGQTDAGGRFAVTATNRTLAPGVRRVAVETSEGSAAVSIQADAPAPLEGAPYRAQRVTGAWRIDWAPPGGGVQTSVVFDQAEPAG